MPRLKVQVSEVDLALANYWPKHAVTVYISHPVYPYSGNINVEDVQTGLQSFGPNHLHLLMFSV